MEDPKYRTDGTLARASVRFRVRGQDEFDHFYKRTFYQGCFEHDWISKQIREFETRLRLINKDSSVDWQIYNSDNL